MEHHSPPSFAHSSIRAAHKIDNQIPFRLARSICSSAAQKSMCSVPQTFQRVHSPKPLSRVTQPKRIAILKLNETIRRSDGTRWRRMSSTITRCYQQTLFAIHTIALKPLMPLFCLSCQLFFLLIPFLPRPDWQTKANENGWISSLAAIYIKWHVSLLAVITPIRGRSSFIASDRICRPWTSQFVCLSLSLLICSMCASSWICQAKQTFWLSSPRLDGAIFGFGCNQQHVDLSRHTKLLPLGISRAGKKSFHFMSMIKTKKHGLCNIRYKLLDFNFD